MEFFLKKLISLFFYPVTWCVIFSTAAIVFLLLSNQRAAISLFIISFAVLLIFSTSFLPDFMLRNLEKQYKPLANIPANVNTIVVLGGGAYVTYQYPANTVLRISSLSRLIEAIRIHQHLPGSHLLLSGGHVFGSPAESEAMKRTAIDLGIDPKNLRLENLSKDTHEEAAELKNRLGDTPFILVTSAFHMRRAMALFKKQGMHPIAAPAQYHTQGQHQSYSLRHYIPNSGNLVYSNIAIHEYMGLLWAKITGEI